MAGHRNARGGNIPNGGGFSQARVTAYSVIHGDHFEILLTLLAETGLGGANVYNQGIYYIPAQPSPSPARTYVDLCKLLYHER